MGLACQGIIWDGAIKLPRGLGAQDPVSLFNVCRAISAAGDVISLDASQLDFIDPLGMTTLRALFERYEPEKRIQVNWLSQKLTSYLARMDFFEGLDIEGVDLTNIGNRHDRGASLLEIKKVTEHRQAEDVASMLAVALTGRLTESDPDAPAEGCTGRNEFDSYRGPIEYALKELLENSLTHARREGRGNASVWVACQFYPKLDVVRMAIVDDGCGFLATLRHHPQLVDKSHRGAINVALLPRVSCNRGGLAAVFGSENQGIGLTTTVRIAGSAGGSVLIASGDALMDTGRNRCLELAGNVWDGVSISFVCKRALLPNVSVPDLLPLDPAGPAEMDDLGLQFR